MPATSTEEPSARSFSGPVVSAGEFEDTSASEEMYRTPAPSPNRFRTIPKNPDGFSRRTGPRVLGGPAIDAAAFAGNFRNLQCHAGRDHIGPMIRRCIKIWKTRRICTLLFPTAARFHRLCCVAASPQAPKLTDSKRGKY